jgi:HK97 family phage portal protein
MPPFNLSNLNSQLRSTASRVLGGVAARLAPKGGSNNELAQRKGFGVDGDAGWSSYGALMGGIFGPGGSGQLNIGLSRFRTTGEFIGAYAADDLVHACALLRAEAVARLTWKLRHRRTGTVLEQGSQDVAAAVAGNHPLFRDKSEWVKFRELHNLLNKPNPYQTWFEFQALQQMYYDLAGNALTLKDNMNGLGWPEYLWPLNPAWTQPIVLTDEGLVGYYYQGDAHSSTWDPDEISHAKQLSPNTPFFWGMSTIHALAQTLDAQIAIDEYQRAFFQNGAVLSGVVSSPPNAEVDPKQYKLAKAEIKDQFQGARNHFKVALLTGGMQWQNVSIPQTEAGMIDWKKLGEDRILRAFRTPKSKLGSQDDAQYNKLDAADRMFYKEAITPLAEMWQDRWTNDVTCYFGFDLEFDVPQFDDLASQVEIAKDVDGMTSLTLWEKRQTMKRVMGKNLILEDDPDSPFNPNSQASRFGQQQEGESPAMHLIFGPDGTPIARLSAGELGEYKRLETALGKYPLKELIEDLSDEEEEEEV